MLRSMKQQQQVEVVDSGSIQSSPLSKYGSYANLGSKQPPLSPMRTVHIDEVPELLMTRPPPTLQLRRKDSPTKLTKTISS